MLPYDSMHRNFKAIQGGCIESRVPRSRCRMEHLLTVQMAGLYIQMVIHSTEHLKQIKSGVQIQHGFCMTF